MSEFEAQNAELFGMVHRNKECYPCGRGPVSINHETKSRGYKSELEEEAMDAQYVPVEDDELAARQKTLIRAGKTIAWTVPAVTFFVGASEGLMNLYFAGALAVPFLFLAVGCWLNK